MEKRVIFTVRPRFYHRSRDVGEDVISEATTGGGALGFESGWLADMFRINVGGFTSQKLYGPEARDGTGLLRERQQSYTVLGEAFDEFKIDDDTSIFAGRTPLNPPHINGNDSRMTPNTFRAVGIRSLAIPNLQISGGHVDRIKFRNSSTFEPMSAFAGAPGTDQGGSAIGARYNFSEEIYVGMIDQYGWDIPVPSDRRSRTSNWWPISEARAMNCWAISAPARAACGRSSFFPGADDSPPERPGHCRRS